MIRLQKTQHGQARTQQRASREGYVELIFSLGLDINDSEIFMTNKSAEFEIRLRQQKINYLRRTECARHHTNEIAILKSEIHQIERIRNWKIVVDGTTLITCYITSRREQRRCLRLLGRSSFGKDYSGRRRR